MLKNFLSVVILIVAITLICGCMDEEKVITADMRGGKISEHSNNDDMKINAKPEQDLIEEQLNSMTLAEKVGQMVMIGVHGTELNDDIRFLLNEFHFGGVIFFDRNMEHAEQVKKLANNIEKIANQKVPMLFALDEEGGAIARGKEFLKPAPSQEEIGNSGNSEEATYWAEFNVDLLRSIGVNINFAPVADVGSRDTRSFSYDVKTVTEFVEASARGYEEKNFLYCLKHFPGIGKSKIDPHQEVSSVDVDKNTLYTEDLPPFKKIISEHDNSRFMVMVGHLKYDAIDSMNSASLSPAVMTDLLRNEMGFSGVVITDDLEMGAIKNNVDLSTLGVRMIQAGGDIALVCHDYASQQVVYNSIFNAVKRGEISEERINESVRRILKLKSHL